MVKYLFPKHEVRGSNPPLQLKLKLLIYGNFISKVQQHLLMSEIIKFHEINYVNVKLLYL